MNVNAPRILSLSSLIRSHYEAIAVFACSCALRFILSELYSFQKINMRFFIQNELYMYIIFNNGQDFFDIYLKNEWCNFYIIILSLLNLFVSFIRCK